jgi:ketosteroid isomerase-like protein
VSQENVELVLGVQNADLARWFRDDATWALNLASYSPDFEHVSVNRVERPVVHPGVEQFRKAWLKWLKPWATYRQDIDRAIDCGDRVLLLVTHHAQMTGGHAEVKLAGASLWTVRDGLIVRMESYTDRSEALKAVGLEE